MRVAAISFLVAAPALVSAAVTPIRRDFTGSATWYYTQTGNAYVTHSPTLTIDNSTDLHSSGSCGSYLSDADYVRPTR